MPTLVLLKPDAVARGLTFEISERFEKRGLPLVACKMLQPTREQAAAHYKPLEKTSDFAALVDFLVSGPAVVLVWDAEPAAVQALAGDADPAKAALGSIRGDLAVDRARNLLECSATAADAKREMAVWGVEEIAAPAPAATAKPAAPAGNGAAAAAAAAGGGDGGDGDGKSKKALAKEAKKAEKAAKKAEHKAAGVTKSGETKKSAGIPEVKQDLIPISFEPPSGTRDFFPDEMRVRNWLFAQFRSVARSFAFQEYAAAAPPALGRARRPNVGRALTHRPPPPPPRRYDAPVLENTALFKRKGGEEITDQMYCFKDKDDPPHEVTLRPEMTPTLARMVLSLGGKILLPVKWFSVRRNSAQFGATLCAIL